MLGIYILSKISFDLSTGNIELKFSSVELAIITIENPASCAFNTFFEKGQSPL